MGTEFGQRSEWNHQVALEWDLLDKEAHSQLQQCVSDLNRLYSNQAALYEVDFDWDGFKWIDFRDMDQSILAFMRRAQNAAEFVIVVFSDLHID
jgi:1,4-alpha-glucan branching enzyme